MTTTKEKIIETSINLFNEKGCLNTSTRHIADELGISIGNLYYHFKNKEEILIAEVDLDLQENVRQNWPFFRDRRIDAFGDITKRAID